MLWLSSNSWHSSQLSPLLWQHQPCQQSGSSWKTGESCCWQNEKEHMCTVNRSTFPEQEDHTWDAEALTGKRKEWLLHRKRCSHAVKESAKVHPVSLPILSSPMLNVDLKSDLQIRTDTFLIYAPHFCISKILCSYTMCSNFQALWVSHVPVLSDVEKKNQKMYPPKILSKNLPTQLLSISYHQITQRPLLS